MGLTQVFWTNNRHTQSRSIWFNQYSVLPV
nr:MAG TPA: hypothetical protein [Caudoviricetes sp.]